MASPSPVDVFDCLHELTYVFRTRVREGVERLHPELTFNEMRVLLHTGRNAGITQKAMIERSHTDKAQMTRILTTLEERGLLERTPGAEDRRVRCLHLSCSGKSLFDQLRHVQDQIAGELLKDMPEDVQEQMVRVSRQACRLA